MTVAKKLQSAARSVKSTAKKAAKKVDKAVVKPITKSVVKPIAKKVDKAVVKPVGDLFAKDDKARSKKTRPHAKSQTSRSKSTKK